VQHTGAELASCQAGTSNKAGYCYIDKTIKDANGNPSPLLESCPDNQQQLLKFVDEGDVKTPVQGAVAFIACLGQSVNDPDAGE